MAQADTGGRWRQRMGAAPISGGWEMARGKGGRHLRSDVVVNMRQEEAPDGSARQPCQAASSAGCVEEQQ